ncbi:MAG: hypothetical protein ACHQRJ_02345 [Alphaproteobacteria bacterium]
MPPLAAAIGVGAIMPAVAAADAIQAISDHVAGAYEAAWWARALGWATVALGGANLIALGLVVYGLSRRGWTLLGPAEWTIVSVRRRQAAIRNSITELRTYIAKHDTRRRWRRTVSAWWWLGLIVALEGGLFWHHVTTRTAPFYPANFDQNVYLLATYHLAEAMRAGGLQGLFDELSRMRIPNGTTFQFQGALLGLILGVGRTSALTLNFLYFAALQIVLFRTVRWLTTSSTLAWIALALLLTQQTLTFWAGGIFDYRIDFAAYCAFGLWCCALLRSGLFKSRVGSAAVGLVAALLISMRFITAVYLGLIMPALLVLVILRLAHARKPLRRALYRLRLRNFFISAATTGILVLPLVWLNRQGLYEYYVVGHVLGPEGPIRARAVGIVTSADALMWYPRSIIFGHLGPEFICAAGLLAIASALLTLVAWRLKYAIKLRPHTDGLIAMTVAILVPAGVLTLDVSKSLVPGDIVCVPVLLALVLAAAIPSETWRSFDKWRGGPREPRLFARIRSCAAALAGLAATMSLVNLPPVHQFNEPDLRRINEAQDWIISYVLRNNMEHPALSLDLVSDCFGPSMMGVAAYERFGKFIDFHVGLGGEIYAVDRDDALRRLAESDVIVLSVGPEGRKHPFYSAPIPFYEAIRSYWPDLWAWSNAHRVLGREFRLDAFMMVIFVRPSVARSTP